MEHFHYRNIGQIGHFFMNFHYARYKKVKKSVPPKLKNEASDHLKGIYTSTWDISLWKPSKSAIFLGKKNDIYYIQVKESFFYYDGPIPINLKQ